MVAILNPTGPGQQIPVDRAVVLIGRSPECDVVLDISSKISRMHCALVQVDADYYIRDLGSMNGIMVGGQRVEKDIKLTNGVEVMIGDVKFLFIENVVTAARQTRRAGAKGSPVFVDETVDVLEVEEIEDIATPKYGRTGGNTSAPSTSGQQHSRTPGEEDDRTVRVRSGNLDDVEIIDAEIIEAVEVIEDVEIISDAEVIDEEIDVIDVIQDVEILDVIDEVEVIDMEVIDMEVIDEVEIVNDQPRKSRPRLR